MPADGNDDGDGARDDDGSDAAGHGDQQCGVGRVVQRVLLLLVTLKS